MVVISSLLLLCKSGAFAAGAITQVKGPSPKMRVMQYFTASCSTGFTFSQVTCCQSHICRAAGIEGRSGTPRVAADNSMLSGSLSNLRWVEGMALADCCGTGSGSNGCNLGSNHGSVLPHLHSDGIIVPAPLRVMHSTSHMWPLLVAQPTS